MNSSVLKKMAILATATSALMGAATTSQAAPAESAFFSATNFNDITVSGSNPYTLTLGANPSFQIGGTTYNVENIFGFYAIRNGDPDTLGATNSDFTASTGVWKAGSNDAGVGSEAGWETTGNDGVYANGSQSFTFNTINTGNIDTFGFHVRLADNQTFQGSNTFFVKVGPVPEPASVGALAIGLLALLRKRRKMA